VLELVAGLVAYLFSFHKSLPIVVILSEAKDLLFPSPQLQHIALYKRRPQRQLV